MARMSKEEIARREGIAYACRLAKEKGLSALEKDMKDRGITDCPVGVSKADMDAFVGNVKANVLDTVMILAACTLQDDFGYGRKRIERFIKGFEGRADEIVGGYATWDDFREQLLDDLKIDLGIRLNDKDVMVRGK